MGLDMYMFAKHKTATQEVRYTETIVETVPVMVKLAYWRKHPDLHSFIETQIWPNKPSYVEGVMFNCIECPLDVVDLALIKTLSTAHTLPKSPGGFFFSESRPEDNEYTVGAIDFVTRFIDENSCYERGTVNPVFGLHDWEIVYDSSW